MDVRIIVAAVLIATAFVGWPIVGKYAQANGATTVAVVSTVASIMILLFARTRLDFDLGVKGIGLLVLAGVLNGIAVYTYGYICGKPETPTGAFIVLVSLCMVVSAPLLDWAFNGTVPTLQKFAGFGMAASAIYLLGK
ncbi:MAG: hypothetical protein UZ21_OP11001000587 [Microgenomates bacterium OLB22]|nr:MAG: hypothetical protein UZ21_OP11001000587 [Microgenomates bacterium OLB22]